MLGAMAMQVDPRILTFVAKSLHLGFGLLECGNIAVREFRHLGRSNRELNREFYELFCQLVPLLAIRLGRQFQYSCLYIGRARPNLDAHESRI
jgi:hypothetical protein